MGLRILVTGATGMVGSQVIQQLLSNEKVHEIVVLGRRKVMIASPKITEIVHEDFTDFHPVKDKLRDLDACIYCIGVYQAQVSKERFFEITCDFQKALTDVLEKTSPHLTFVLFGAQGADPSGKSKVTFAAGKGKAENLLHQTRFPLQFVVRPGYIAPTGEIKSGGWIYALMRPLGNLMMAISPRSTGVTDAQLAKAMVHLATTPPSNSKTFENRELYDF